MNACILVRVCVCVCMHNCKLNTFSNTIMNVEKFLKQKEKKNWKRINISINVASRRRGEGNGSQPTCVNFCI